MAGLSWSGGEPIRFRARWVSGYYRNPDGRLRFPSANRCLEVILTDEDLHIRMMTLFSSLFGSRQLGYKQSIPVSRVLQVEKARFRGWWHTARITFTTDTHQQLCLELGFTGPLPQIGSSQLKDRDRFFHILQAVIDKVQPK